MLTSANRSPTRRNTRCLPSALNSENWDSSVKRTPLQRARRYRMWALPTQVSYDDELPSGRDPDEDDKHVDELPWDGFWQFVQKFFGYANRLWRSWAGMVTRGLWLWGWLDLLLNCLKHLWRWLIVDNWTLNSRAQLWWTFLQSACQLHTLATSVVLCRVIKLNIL